jgi:F-type H+-transporting ATPase subunit b
MLSHLLVLAQATTHSAEAASGGDLLDRLGITPILHNFGISWPFFLAQVVNFSVVAFILWKFAFKPVLATLDDRQKKIAAGLKYAEEMEAKLDATQQESAAMLKKASADAARLIDEARKTAKDFLDKQMLEAIAKAADVHLKAQQAIELEHKKMLADARTEIARLVVVTTERVLARKLTDADRAAYNDTAARELSNV